jgi:hypothetical protein
MSSPSALQHKLHHSQGEACPVCYGMGVQVYPLALWFMPKGTSINQGGYLFTLQEHPQVQLQASNCKYFQKDDAPCHTSRSVTEYGIQTIGKWPGSSPDLNPIESCWHILKRQVSELKPTSEVDLIQNILQACTSSISDEYCRNLVSSMSSCISAVLQAKDGLTRY